MSGSCDCGRGGHDERHAPKVLYTAPGRTALDYRVGDYGSFRAAMLDRLASPAYPALRGLTVRTPDDPSIGLLDAWAVVGDLLTFHSERIADEGYLRTADDHRSLALLGRLVGHRPRPGIAADTHLAYTLDRDPRAEDVPVLIPRGARANSVPSTSDEESQAFETSDDLVARWAWNELAVRRAPPALLTPDDLRKRPEIFVSGTDTSCRPGTGCSSSSAGTRRAPGSGCCFRWRVSASTGARRSRRSGCRSPPRPPSPSWSPNSVSGSPRTSGRPRRVSRPPTTPTRVRSAGSSRTSTPRYSLRYAPIWAGSRRPRSSRHGSSNRTTGSPRPGR